MREWSRQQKNKGLSIGFVPTMGCLHEGHHSLISRSLKENDRTVVSIFVNKLQFGPAEDFKRYPRPLQKDIRLLKTWRVDALFHPLQNQMYSKGFVTHVEVEGLDSALCGLRRPGHFKGVATIVAKLLNIVNPDKAYFGQKDYQQWRIVGRLARDLNIPTRIIGCPTVREPGGLALSSRNSYLTRNQRLDARGIFAALQWGKKLIKFRKRPIPILLKLIRNRLQTIPGARMDYVQLVDAKTLQSLRKPPQKASLLACAVFLGPARLIDNIVIES